uniref:Uncharacterized protein n=1 Tax=Vespula pensylvanica TaxID=30213 RepID=A0A834JLX0_VESPE|nr:hypothetical protein H0235_017724 [Vespula pensylvanica]
MKINDFVPEIVPRRRPRETSSGKPCNFDHLTAYNPLPTVLTTGFICPVTESSVVSESCAYLGSSSSLLLAATLRRLNHKETQTPSKQCRMFRSMGYRLTLRRDEGETETETERETEREREREREGGTGGSVPGGRNMLDVR